MSHDATIPRFFAYLSLFTFMMLMLVTADNLVQLFFGWEGVGLASYLLIGYWYERESANRAGDEGLHRQPRGRLVLHARPRADLLDLPVGRVRDDLRGVGQAREATFLGCLRSR
jgi:NADH-quinone oxidoreductase subunit L